MDYMSCYEQRYTSCIGGMFIFADGSRRVIPDHYLYSAKIQSDATLLRLSYSSCVVDIYGYHLSAIYNDVIIGKLGVVKVAGPADDGKVASAKCRPFVTNIIYVPMSPDAAADLESRDA